jgi:hypothetical protein
VRTLNNPAWSKTMCKTVTLSDREWDLFHEQVVPHFGLDTSFQWHFRPDDAARYLASYCAQTDAEPAAEIEVGNLFLSRYPELDSADSSEIGINRFVGRDGERWTPARSVWRVTEVSAGLGNEFVSIVCDETGGWINPSPLELLDRAIFTRVSEVAA